MRTANQRRRRADQDGRGAAACETLEPRSLLSVYFAPVGINVQPDDAQSLALIDATGDGAADLLVTEGGIGRELFLKRNRGDGRFKPVESLLTLEEDATWIGAAAGRFDADQRVDIAVAYRIGEQTFVQLIRGWPSGEFTHDTPPQLVPDDAELTRIDAARVEGAPAPHWLILGAQAAHIEPGTEEFIFEHVPALDGALGAPAVGDATGDGRDDLAVVIPSSGSGDSESPSFIRVISRNLDGSWRVRETGRMAANDDTTDGYRSVVIGDATGDGRPDLVVSTTSTHQYGASVQVLATRAGAGAPRWRAPQTVFSAFEGDNTKVIMVTGAGAVSSTECGISISQRSVYRGRDPYAAESVSVLLPKPGSPGAWRLRTLGSSTNYAFYNTEVGTPPRGFVVTDLNRDGLLDAAALRQPSNSEEYWGRGPGDAATIWRNMPTAPDSGANSAAVVSNVGVGALISSGSRFVEARVNDPDGGIVEVMFCFDRNGNGKLDYNDLTGSLRAIPGRPGVFGGPIHVAGRFLQPGSAPVIIRSLDSAGFWTQANLVVGLP